MQSTKSPGVFASLLLTVVLLTLTTCEERKLPKVTTLAATNITPGNAETGGNVTSEGESPVTDRGVVWDTIPKPTIELQTKKSEGTGIGSFKTMIFPLNYLTTYYVRAYATNSQGTAYGNEISFKTPATGPYLETSAVTNVTSTSAVCGGRIFEDGGASVTARGVIWSTSNSFNIGSPNKTTDGAGTGTYVSTITGLTPSTKYYVIAYATNSAANGLGSPVREFTTRAAEPAKVFFFEVIATPTDFESVTIKNNSGSSKDLSGWTIGDLNNPTAYKIPNGTVLAQGETKLFQRTTLGFAINDSGETLYLKDAAGTTIDSWTN